MRRETLINGLQRVVRDIDQTNLALMIDRGVQAIRREAGRDNFAWISFSTLQDYFYRVAQYSDVEMLILEVFDISPLADPDFWQAMLKEPAPQALVRAQRSLTFAVKHAPRLVGLLKQDFVETAKENPERLPGNLKGRELLTVTLAEDDGQYSSPSRVIYAIGSINELYSVFAELDDCSGNDLIVLACDSGSDKSFDFLGVAKVVEQVRGVIMDIWDRRVFHKHAQVSAALDLITQSLPILEKVDQLVVEKTIEPERAELLKRRILDASSKFIEAGATIDEMEAAATASPRSLMRAEPKLLAAPLGTPSAVGEGDAESFPSPPEDDESNDPPSREEFNKLKEMLKNYQEQTAEDKRRESSTSARNSTAPSKGNVLNVGGDFEGEVENSDD